MDPSLSERASRITPQEWRVIALSIEGVPASQACEALGIALGTLESHKQAIRRKLGIAKGQRFEAFVREHFAEDVPTPPPPAEKAAKAAPAPKDIADRRVRWLLRITLEEVQEVAMSAGLRAQLLSQTAQRMSAGDHDEAKREVEDLKQVADDLQKLFRDTLAAIRARGDDAPISLE